MTTYLTAALQPTNLTATRSFDRHTQTYHTTLFYLLLLLIPLALFKRARRVIRPLTDQSCHSLANTCKKSSLCRSIITAAQQRPIGLFHPEVWTEEGQGYPSNGHGVFASWMPAA